MTKQIPESRIALNSVVIDDSKRESKRHHLRVTRKYLCSNGDCLSEVAMSSTPEKLVTRFYFSKTLECPICASVMYEVTE